MARRRTKSFWQKSAEVINPLMTLIGFVWTVIQILEYNKQKTGVQESES